MSLVSLNLGSHCLQLCKKNCRKLDFWIFWEQLLFRGVFKPSQASKMEVIAKIVNVFKPFNCSLLKLSDVWPGSEFTSAILHNSRLKSYIVMKLLFRKCNKKLIQRSYTKISNQNDSFLNNLIHCEAILDNI